VTPSLHELARERTAASACGSSEVLTRLLSYQVADALAKKKLVLVLRKYEPAPVPVSLVFVRDRRQSGKLRAFLEFAAPRLRARLDALAM
jgi:DNA-binding transcriptional LysR family regulator